MKCEHRKVFIRDNEKFDDIFECEQEECGEFGKAILDDLYAEIDRLRKRNSQLSETFLGIPRIPVHVEIDRLSSKLQMIAKILEEEQ